MSQNREILRRSTRIQAGFVAAAIALSISIAAPKEVQAGDIVFVPLGGNNEIIAIDVTSNKIVNRVPAIPAVHGLAKTPDGMHLIAGNFDEREPGEGMPAKPAGVSADEHAAHHAKPADRPANKGESVSTLSVIRAIDGAVIRKIDVPGAVHHVAASPNGFFAVVTHPNQDAVSVVDLRSFKVSDVIKTGAVPNYAAFSSDGKLLYVSNSGDNTVSVVDTANWRTSKKIEVGESPEHLVVRADLGKLFVNNTGDGTVSVAELVTNRVVNVLKIGSDPHGIDVSDDGRFLFVSAMGDNKLAAINIKSGDRRELKLSPAPYHLKVITGHGVVYVSSAEAPKIWVVDAGAVKVNRTIDLGGKGHQMAQ